MNTSIDNLQDVIDTLQDAVDGAKIALKRSMHMNQIHPYCGNEKCVEVDRFNLNILTDCLQALNFIKPYPEED